MTLLRYARSTYIGNRSSGDAKPCKRGGLSRSQRKKGPSRSALKRSTPPQKVRAGELEPSHRSRSAIERDVSFRSRSASDRDSSFRSRSASDREFATTIIDPPRRSRASYAVMAAMLLGGAAGLGLGFLRAGGSEEALLVAASTSAPAALEVLPPLDDARAQQTSSHEAAGASSVVKMASVKPSSKAPAAKAAAVATSSVSAAAGTVVVAPAEKAAAALADEAAREIVTDRLRERESLSLALSRHSVGIDDINALVASLRGKVDLRGLRAGDVFRLESSHHAADNANAAVASTTNGAAFTLAAFEYRPRLARGAPVRWRVERDGEGWRVEKKVTPVTTKVVALGGEVRSSLYVAMRALGEGGALVSRFVDVFAWDIDFYRQPQKGDTFKVLVEKQFADGRFVGYGKVLAAEYVNAGDVHRGFAFNSKDDKVAGYFDENGRAREKTFLKNPLEIALITSSYGQRFHPVLRRQKAHHGVDYGAGKGTAFWSVADGVVKEARYSRTAGNMIVVRHINGYETEYFHASRFADGIRPGAKVKQRQIIGYVGNTGRSTGPHLHFGMKKRGGYVDPGKQVFPAANPVPQRYLQEFKEQVGPLLVELEALENV